jgi:hypothetical protein
MLHLLRDRRRNLHHGVDQGRHLYLHHHLRYDKEGS